MRILMISDVFFPRINGVSTSISTFANEYVQQGHLVHLIAPKYDNSDISNTAKDQSNEDWIFRVVAKKVLFDPEDRMMSIKGIRQLLPTLRSNQYDVLHIHTPFVAHYQGVWLAKKLQLPVVETYHTFFEEYLYHYVPIMPKYLLKLLARKFSVSQCMQVDHLVVPSGPMAKVLQHYGVAKSHSIVPTGVNITKPKQNTGSQFRQKYGIKAEQPVLVHIGRIAFEKNIDFLVSVTSKLVAHFPDLLLLIAGEGPALKSLKALVKKLHIEKHVKFVGYLDRDTELVSCYQAGDIFVFASRTETQGLVLLEAMLLGVPVVSTAKMGTKDILIDGKGALIAEEEVEDFSKKVLQVLQEPRLKASLSREGVAYAKAWEPCEMASRVLEIYQDLIANKACVTNPHRAC